MKAILVRIGVDGGARGFEDSSTAYLRVTLGDAPRFQRWLDRQDVNLLKVTEEMRTDPLWEFGSFGCTGCHARNLILATLTRWPVPGSPSRKVALWDSVWLD